MRLLALALVLVCSSVANAQTVCVEGRCFLRPPTVVVQSDSGVMPSVCVSGCRSVTVSAQEHAEHLAATGSFSHCNRRGVGYEGLGFSTTSPDAACRRACYWGQRPVVAIGTAWCPIRRGWIAVVRYR